MRVKRSQLTCQKSGPLEGGGGEAGHKGVLGGGEAEEGALKPGDLCPSSQVPGDAAVLFLFG